MTMKDAAGKAAYDKSLRPVPDKADVVRAVFGWYADGMDGREAGAAPLAHPRAPDASAFAAGGRRPAAPGV